MTSRRKTSRNIGARGTYPAPRLPKRYDPIAEQLRGDSSLSGTLKERAEEYAHYLGFGGYKDEKFLAWAKKRRWPSVREHYEAGQQDGFASRYGSGSDIEPNPKLVGNRRRRTSRNGDLAALKARVARLPRGGEKSRLQWLLDESRGNPSYLREIEYSLGRMGA